MPRRLVLTLAVATGASVACNYYGQPLLDAIAASLHVSASAAAIIVTTSQLGYAAGLVLLVPLGDMLERRGLISGLLVVSAMFLAVAAAAPSLPVLAAALLLVGVTSTCTQVIVPLASDLADGETRGRIVGMVMSGLLLGILVARTVSGLIAQVAGWRTVYVVAAVAVLLCAAALRRELPRVEGRAEMPYPALLASAGRMFLREGAVRRRMVYGSMGMFGFSAFWTALTLMLSDPPYSYGEATIGLFGLFGVVGAGAAQISGRLADRGLLGRATGIFTALVLASWGASVFGVHSVALLILGIVVLDLGVQGAHIANQSRIYELFPDARSRVTMVYMTGNFVLGAIGSISAAAAYDAGGWDAVCALGAGAALIAFAAWLQEQSSLRNGTVARRDEGAPDVGGAGFAPAGAGDDGVSHRSPRSR